MRKATPTENAVSSSSPLAACSARGEAQNGCIRFDGSARFYIAAVDAKILGSLAEYLLTKPAARLGSAELRVVEVSVEPEPGIDPSKPILVKTLSPITAYSTLQTPDGKKKTYYYTPQEKVRSESLIANLRCKAQELGWAAYVDEGALHGDARIHRTGFGAYLRGLETLAWWPRPAV